MSTTSEESAQEIVAPKSDFQKDWQFASSILHDVEGATSYVVRPTEKLFKTGRKKIECTFYDDDNIAVSVRSGMELISKKGKPYQLFSTKEPKTGCSGKISYDDVFGGCSAKIACGTF